MEYRAMRRFGQALTADECKDLLSTVKRGVLSVTGDGGHPYGVPLNFYYARELNCIFFHGAKEGHKIDSLKKDPRASFCIFNDGEHVEGDWAFTVKSVIVFGKIEFISDIGVAEKYCRLLAARYTSDPAYIDKEISRAIGRVQVLCFHIESMTGKHIREA